MTNMDSCLMPEILKLQKQYLPLKYIQYQLLRCLPAIKRRNINMLNYYIDYEII